MRFLGTYYSKSYKQWVESWHTIVVGTTGLRNCRRRLDLHYDSFDEIEDLSSKAEWVQQILKVRGLKNFDMAIIVSEKFGQWPENSTRAEELRRHLEKTCIRSRDEES